MIEISAHLFGEHIDVKALSLGGQKLVLQTPRIFEAADGSRTAVFRFGAVVFARPVGALQAEIPPEIAARLSAPCQRVETERITVVIGEPAEPGAILQDRLTMTDFSVERFAVLANVLAKSVALAHDEERIHQVFETLEPFARSLATNAGRILGPGKSLKLLGDALLAQHRMVGRVEVHEKPDILWERPDLTRLYARLDEEYELSERARELSRKVKVIEESARAIADVADAHISRRLEIAIVALIVLEVILSLYGMFTGGH